MRTGSVSARTAVTGLLTSMRYIRVHGNAAPTRTRRAGSATRKHPCDESWGYQSTGFFAPTSRYGTPLQLMELVDRCHRRGIGVIIDFVPVHFAVDHYALTEFDGTKLYEYPADDIGYNEWGSRNFDHSKGEVRSFIQSAADYWLSVYHFDGLRMDAVRNMIYWNGDERRGENRTAIQFLKDMNSGLKARHPSAIISAEDSSAYPKVTAPVFDGGLGFDYKWDLGWMHDTLEYFRSAPMYRSRDYHKLTFSMLYFYNEKYILPLSHDEVVHGKATVAQKMNGQYPEKFPQARALYMYMTVHPGKKLNFMGSEFAQLREWDEKRQQDWDMLKYPLHDSFREYIKALNKIYLEQKALHYDYDPTNFMWEDCNSVERCVYAIRRKAAEGDILAVLNFSDWYQSGYSVVIGKDYEAELLLVEFFSFLVAGVLAGEAGLELDDDFFFKVEASLEDAGVEIIICGWGRENIDDGAENLVIVVVVVAGCGKN